MPRSHHHVEGISCTGSLTTKQCDEAYTDWQAAQSVELAARVVREGRAGAFRGEASVFAQTVLVLAGLRETVTNGDGVETEAPFARRVLAMIERYRREHPDELPEVQHAGS